MRNETPLAVIWRRKWIVIATFLVFVATTYLVSKSLPEVYSTDTSLLVALPTDAQSFDAVQASQAVARSYSDIIDSPNFAQLVANQLGDDASATELMGATSVEPVPETQLLTITAEDPSPARAKQIADAYADVFIDYAEARLEDTTTATVSLADEAPLPREPARPQPALYVVVAGLLGIAIGLAIAFLRDRLDRRLRTSEDVEGAFDKAVLTRVPRRGRSEASVSAFREAYRILRTNLQFAGSGVPLRSMLVTSGGEGEGKTTTVLEAAIASAEVGMKVIAVEGDFRRPMLQRELVSAEAPLEPGLSNYLVGGGLPLERVIYPTNRPNIDIVPAGPLPPSPSALLDSSSGRGTVSQLLEHADLVVIDSPPLNIGADASVLSRWVDGVLLVVDLDRATDRSVGSAFRQLDTVHAAVLGIVLNRDKGAEVSAYGYYAPTTARGAGSRLAGMLRSEPRIARPEDTNGGRPAPAGDDVRPGGGRAL